MYFTVNRGFSRPQNDKLWKVDRAGLVRNNFALRRYRLRVLCERHISNRDVGAAVRAKGARKYRFRVFLYFYDNKHTSKLFKETRVSPCETLPSENYICDT